MRFDIHHPPAIYPGSRARRPSAAEGALMLAGSLALWLGTRGIRSLPVRLGGSVLAAALRTHTPVGRRGLDQGLRWIPFRRPIGR